jgi:hypothetical protein
MADGAAKLAGKTFERLAENDLHMLRENDGEHLSATVRILDRSRVRVAHRAPYPHFLLQPAAIARAPPQRSQC